jgi:hypothetical protein
MSRKRSCLDQRDLEATPLSGQQLALIDDMRSMLDDKIGSDVELQLDDGTCIPAHRALLAKRSKVFERMMFGQMREAAQPTVRITGIQSAVMRGLCEFVYTAGISSFLQEFPVDDAQIAAMLQELRDWNGGQPDTEHMHKHDELAKTGLIKDALDRRPFFHVAWNVMKQGNPSCNFDVEAGTALFDLLSQLVTTMRLTADGRQLNADDVAQALPSVCTADKLCRKATKALKLAVGKFSGSVARSSAWEIEAMEEIKQAAAKIGIHVPDSPGPTGEARKACLTLYAAAAAPLATRLDLLRDFTADGRVALCAVLEWFMVEISDRAADVALRSFGVSADAAGELGYSGEHIVTASHLIQAVSNDEELRVQFGSTLFAPSASRLQQALLDLAAAADQYDLGGLVACCEHELTKQLGLREACAILRALASGPPLPAVKAHCLSVVVKHRSVIPPEELQMMPTESLVDIIKQSS